MWFEVDKEGLAKILERRGKEFAIYELIQNAWDQNVKEVKVTFEKPKYGYAWLTVEDDDPEGFSDLSHAWRLFADSSKKADPEKRGRFNLGEKLVLAICREASIRTVKGSVLFDKDGRHNTRKPTTSGSVFSGLIKVSTQEYEDILCEIDKLIPPEGIETRINGILLTRPKLLKTIEVTLPTEIADPEGNLKKTERKTKVEIYEARSEKGTLYEMGIPVVETGDKWNVSVNQKVPLNLDRDNVTPAYLKKIRTAVLDAMFQDLKEEDVNQAWVRDGIGKATPEAVKHCIETRFGKDAVIFDPSDLEANKLSVIEGRNVVKGPMMSAEEWERVRESKLMLPAGQVTPSPKPYSKDPNAKPEDLIPREAWTEGMLRMETYVKWLGQELFNKDITIRMTKAGSNFSACYTPGEMTFNITTLGRDWFKIAFDNRHDELVVHEFAHEYESDHFSRNFYAAIAKVGAKMIALALEKPEQMRKMKTRTT